MMYNKLFNFINSNKKIKMKESSSISPSKRRKALSKKLMLQTLNQEDNIQLSKTGKGITLKNINIENDKKNNQNNINNYSSNESTTTENSPKINNFCKNDIKLKENLEYEQILLDYNLIDFGSKYIYIIIIYY